MKKTVPIISALALGLASAAPAWAVCPVCTIAVGAGLGLSRWLGIDDTVSGVWVGGLIVSLTLWTADWLEKKNFRLRGLRALTAVFYILITVLPLYWTGIMGHPLNTLWNVDKLLLGMAFGGLSFWFAADLYALLKKRNGGRAWFPYQKIAMPVGALSLLSLALYLITR
jgi:hypothetical protein